MNAKSNCYWNLLNHREKSELVRKVTGLKNAPKEFVGANVVPGIIESYLNSHQDEVQPKFQAFMRENKKSVWTELNNPSFDRSFVEYIANKQVNVFSAFAVGVVDLLNNKLVYINY